MKPGRGPSAAPSIADGSVARDVTFSAAGALLGVSIFPVFDDQPRASPSSWSIVLPVLIHSGRSSRISAPRPGAGAGEFIAPRDAKPVLPLLDPLAVHPY